MSEYHIPVLLDESVTALVGDAVSGIYADATFGGGGHSREILSRLTNAGRLIAFDRDRDALANKPDDSRLVLIHNNFRFIHNYVLEQGYGDGIDGILADLGVSSHQFDTADRGFSFRFDAALDMRMNRSARMTAADIVNGYSEEELERVLRLYGEVEGSRKMARLICQARTSATIETTGQLDKAIECMLPKFAEHKVLAKVYQALRIEVNQEMNTLSYFKLAAQGGNDRLSVTDRSGQTRNVMTSSGLYNLMAREYQYNTGDKLNPGGIYTSSFAVVHLIDGALDWQEPLSE